MSYDLRITFTGLCLFVPDDRDAANQRMHVLMPATDTHPHFARLIYNSAYERQGSMALDRSLACHPLDRMQVRLTGPSGGAAQELPADIVNLRLTLDKHVSPDKLLDTPPASVKSRITLNQGAITGYELGRAWDMPYHKSLPMTWQVDWTIRGLTAEPLQWERVSLDTALAQPLPEIYPIGGVVHLYLYHVIADELPSTNGSVMVAVEPNEGDQAPHFAEYFSLATGGITGVPTYSATQPEILIGCPQQTVAPLAAHVHAGHSSHAARATATATAASATGFSSDPERGGSPFTCMTASAPIG